MKNPFRKRKEEKEKREDRQKELDRLKDLWLNYKKVYFLFHIHYVHPTFNSPRILDFPYVMTREEQRQYNKMYSDPNRVLAYEIQNIMNMENQAYWPGNKKNKGVVIPKALFVEFEKIDKATFDSF